jgi:hypothetical protein
MLKFENGNRLLRYVWKVWAMMADVVFKCAFLANTAPLDDYCMSPDV